MSRLRVLIRNGTKLSKVVLRVVSTVTQFIRALKCVEFTCVNKIEAMCERLRVNVKVERGSTFFVLLFASVKDNCFCLKA